MCFPPSKRTLILLATLACLLLGVLAPARSSGVHAFSQSSKKKTCKWVTKKVNGHKKRVKVCKPKKKTPTPTPTPTSPCLAADPSPNPTVAGPPGVHTLMWLAGLYPDKLPQYLGQLAQM